MLLFIIPSTMNILLGPWSTIVNYITYYSITIELFNVLTLDRIITIDDNCHNLI